MKKGTPQHPKVDRLMRGLDCHRPLAVGVLEMLWHFTETRAPQGDIGRWTNQEIADGICWPGDADTLVATLVASRWFDVHPDPAVRLLVHDWPQHANDAVHMALARRTELFADGTRPNLRRFSANERNEIEARFRAHGRRVYARKSALPSVAVALPSPPIALPEPSRASSQARRAHGNSNQACEPARPPAGPLASEPSLSTDLERHGAPGALADAQAELVAALEREASESSLPMGVLLTKASRTPKGRVIANVHDCDSIPWLRTTLCRLEEIRLSRQADATPQGKPPPSVREQRQKAGMVAMIRGGLKGDGTLPGKGER